MKNNRNKLVLFFGIAIVVVGALLAYAYTTQQQPVDSSKTTNSDINYDPPTQEQIEAGQATKHETTSSDTPNEPASTLGVSYTAANQNGSLLQVRILIDSVVRSDAKCTLVLSKEGKEVTKSASVQTLPNSSTCKGFDIPVSELSPGTWDLGVSVVSGDLNGKAQKTIQID